MEQCDGDFVNSVLGAIGQEVRVSLGPGSMAEERKLYKVLVGKPEGKSPL
jgi:hypothetical protein